MPNVTWQEPQIVVDLLAMNVLADKNGMSLPGEREIAIVSPWLSDVEIFLRPGPWHSQIVVGEWRGSSSLQACLAAFATAGWRVDVAVLAYGTNPCGIRKDPDKFSTERALLRELIRLGASVYMVPDLHAKGIVTPLGIVTGSTNITNSGLFAQSQNSNYFAHNHPDFFANRVQLLGQFRNVSPTPSIP